MQKQMLKPIICKTHVNINLQRGNALTMTSLIKIGNALTMQSLIKITTLPNIIYC